MKFKISKCRDQECRCRDTVPGGAWYLVRIKPRERRGWHVPSFKLAGAHAAELWYQDQTGTGPETTC